ncbi:MocR-like transcriptional regulator GabR [Neobacillus cucumis]|uniref:MocR-like transcriptional regulator GabR n=1 Tax=Neobacillus cucumis TaxID=1740721 RepID=UPI0019662664|nr:PLP-dependent aminotransferase family protein [Neobacillus cucumis]MBM7651328.1 GntR family transcriptional regulator/MocR family aminotransferase [Neobacillus cucumis]
MFILIDKQRNMNFIYQQIYEGIKDNILKGRLKANEKLPSKRSLAEQLNVSINSVSFGYEQLLAEGYIYTIERKGYFVENITEILQRGNLFKDKLPEDLKEDPVNRDGWLSLSHMASDISFFPFKEWMKCQERAVQSYKRELSEIAYSQGPYEVRDTICHMIALTRGVNCEPEQIVLGAGTQLLVGQLMELISKDSVIAVENPGYSRFYQTLKKMNFAVHPVSLDDHGIKMAEIKATKANVVFVTPSHQFPTGKIMPISRRIELLNWTAEGDNRYIVEDDYDSEFKYETDNIPSLQSLDRNHRVIYMGTFSKTLLPGLRISYMVLPPDLLREYREYYANFMQYSNSLILFTLHYFIEGGEYARHVKKMNHLYERRRKLLIADLRRRFQDEIKIEDVPAGLHFLAHFQTEKSYREIEERALQLKLEIYSMRRFMLKKNVNKENSISLVLGFANLKEENITEVVERLYFVFH